MKKKGPKKKTIAIEIEKLNNLKLVEFNEQKLNNLKLVPSGEISE